MFWFAIPDHCAVKRVGYTILFYGYETDGLSMGGIENEPLKVGYPNVKIELPQYFERKTPLF